VLVCLRPEHWTAGEAPLLSIARLRLGEDGFGRPYPSAWERLTVRSVPEDVDTKAFHVRAWAFGLLPLTSVLWWAHLPPTDFYPTEDFDVTS